MSILAASLVALQTQSDEVRPLLEAFLAQSRVPALVALIERPNLPLRTYEIGTAQIEQKTPVKSDMVFDCGSIGKVFTTVTALRLVENGTIKLDAPLGQYVPEVREDWKSATLRQLLSHTAGLPEYVLYEGIRLTDSFTQEKFFEVMADKPLDYAPGSEWQYSNTNFFMAMLMLERAAKKAFPDLLNENVFRPAGMTETGPLLNKQTIEKRKAQGYWIDQEVQPIAPMPGSPDIGSGGHFTTVTDLHKFGQALFQKNLLKPETLKQMTTPAPLPKGRSAPYGLGLFLRKVNGIDVWSHGGNSVGYAGSLTYIPTQKTFVVLLGNAYQMSGDAVALNVARKYLPELNPKPLQAATDPDPEKSKKLLKVLHALANQNLDHEGMSEEMKSRLKRPRGQMTLPQFAPAKEATIDAFMGTEPQGPDALWRLRVKTPGRNYLATFTVDAEGKVYSLSLSPA